MQVKVKTQRSKRALALEVTRAKERMRVIKMSAQEELQVETALAENDLMWMVFELTLEMRAAMSSTLKSSMMLYCERR